MDKRKSSSKSIFWIATNIDSVMFVCYLVAYICIITYAPAREIDSLLDVVHFIVATISPIGNLTRSMFISLNIFSILCKDNTVVPYPGEITLYGGPILYLILQSLALFCLLLWWDSGMVLCGPRQSIKTEDPEELIDTDEDINKEILRASTSNDPLKVLRVSKHFGKYAAVQNITFGVESGEVFALLGPNGAGKSTTINLIRGDMRPTRDCGDIFVENISMSKHRAMARSHLGVCPQFDAMDQMTVLEHLRFYARIRGVTNVEYNVNQVIRAVGLLPYGHRMAAKLSGGNKRKLSLGIALMGNPTVLLLDEPSSGMDAASKRVMWRTLASIVPGRSLVLTTHSMEEADALANRAGIMAKKMLALGTTDHLRRRYGSSYNVHIVHREAPHTSSADMKRIRDWVSREFPTASIESKTYHGQLRFSVPISQSRILNKSPAPTLDPIKLHGDLHLFEDDDHSTCVSDTENSSSNIQITGISSLFSLLEKNKSSLSFEYYSVSPATLDQVFLNIVGDNNVEEADQ